MAGSVAEHHAIALNAAFYEFGFDVVLLAAGPFTTAKNAKGIWVQPITETDLGGLDVQSDRPSRVLALKRSDAEGINRKAKVQAPDGVGGIVRNFRIDGQVEIFSDHYRVQLVPDESAVARSFSASFSQSFG